MTVEKSNNHKSKTVVQKYIKFRSSIYGQVIYVIALLSLVLFVSFGITFRSVNEKYMQSVLKQCGNRIGFLVEGALYKSMLENDKSTLQNTMKIINKMPGIDHINMYDHNDSLVFTSCVYEYDSTENHYYQSG